MIFSTLEVFLSCFFQTVKYPLNIRHELFCDFRLVYLSSLRFTVLGFAEGVPSLLSSLRFTVLGFAEGVPGLLPSLRFSFLGFAEGAPCYLPSLRFAIYCFA